MRCIAFLTLLYALITVPLLAQNRQAFLTSGKDNIVLYDSQADTSGNQVSVGLEWQQGTSYSNYQPIAIKTSKNGTRIWTRTLNYTGAVALKVRIAANGDYLILAKDNWPMLWRLTPSGSHVFASRYTYTNQYNDYITGITELPNHHIAICGFNDFTFSSSGNKILKGYFIHTDSAGKVINPPGNFGINLQTYGNDHSSSSQDQFLFNDVACVGNKLYFAGAYQPAVGSARGLVITTDLNGNNPVYRITASSFVYGSTTAPAAAFTSITSMNGKVFVGSIFTSNATTQNQFIGALDTSNFSVTGVEMHVINKLPYHAQSFIRDSVNWYVAFQPSNSTSAFEQRHTIFTGKITNGSLVQARRIFQDSAITFGGLSVNADTLVCNGSVVRTGYTAGFFTSYNTAASSSLLCNVTDTLVQSSACSITMSALSGPPNSVRSLSSNGPVSPGSATCVYDMHLCGTVPCSNSGLAATLTPLSPTSVCPGDTVRLLKMATCNHLAWYKDGLQLPDVDTLLIPTDTSGKGSGKYFIVVDNGICSDTSTAVQVHVYPAPVVPVISQNRDTLFSTAGAAYQWLDSNGNAISGASNLTYFPLSRGRYSVRVIDSNGCRAVSASFLFIPPIPESVTSVVAPAISIYPNPARITFTVSKHTGEPVEIGLQGSTGNYIRRWKQAEVTRTYNVADMNLPAGVYIISVSGGGLSGRYKLVVSGTPQ